MRLLKTALVLASWFVCASALAYETAADGVLYRVYLWRDGDPSTAVAVAGAPAGRDGQGRAEHEQCSVDVTRSTAADGARWTIRVTPKGAWGVAEVHFPMLLLPRLTDDYLVTGERIGQRTPVSFFLNRGGDRLCEFAERAEMQKYPEFRNKKSLYFGRYPAQSTLQLMMYEGGGEGVMLWTPDAEMWTKDFVVSESDLGETWRGKALRAYVAHFPANTGARGTGFTSPYPVVATPYRGGWYNAAVVYRDWAVKQWWCAKGRVCERPETPAWFKNTHAFWGVAGRPAWVRQWSERAIKLLDGRKAAAQLMNWSKLWEAGDQSSPMYMPASDEKGFVSNLAFAKNGLHLAPYFMFSGAVPTHAPVYGKVKDSRVLFPDGTVSEMYWGTVDLTRVKDRNPAEMCEGYLALAREIEAYREELRKAFTGPLNEALINRMDTFSMTDGLRDAQKAQLRQQWGKDAKVIDRLKFYQAFQRLCLSDPKYLAFCADQVEACVQKYGATAAYFDTFPHSILPCYDPKHGHPTGYGPYLTKGSRDLCAEVLRRCPSLVLCCESGSGEALLDVMHVTYFKGIRPEHAIPLFPVVYNGYTFWTSWWMWPPYKTTESFTSNIAFSTHLGYLPGGAISGGVISQLTREMNLPLDHPMVACFRAAVDIRSKYSDWVAGGWRLYDPPVDGVEAREVLWSTKDGGRQYPMRLKPVLASLWARRDDNTKGLLLLSNWTGEQQRVSVEGRKVELAPYAWQGIELAIAGLDQRPPADAPGEQAKAPEAAPAAPKGRERVYGKVVEVGAGAGTLVLRHAVLGAGGGAFAKTTFRVTVATRCQGFQRLSDLKIGDNVEVSFTPAKTGPAEAIQVILDPKGDKEDDG